MSIASTCPKCGHKSLEAYLQFVRCHFCDFQRKRPRKIAPKLDKPILKKQPLKKITKADDDTVKSEANSLANAMNDNARLGNLDQDYSNQDIGQYSIKTSKIFDQDIITISSIDNILNTDQEIATTPPEGPPHSNPPIIPPITPPGPPPFYPPVEPPPGPPSPPPVNCDHPPVLTISATTTTVAPGGTVDLLINGGAGDITMSVDDPGNIVANVEATSLTIKPDATNPGCINNIIITVSDECHQEASLTMGINAHIGSDAYLVPGSSSSSVYGGYDISRMCCRTNQNWQFCDGHQTQSSYYCETCAPCQGAPVWNCTEALGWSLCPGADTCQDPFPGSKETLQADGCCPGEG